MSERRAKEFLKGMVVGVLLALAAGALITGCGEANGNGGAYAEEIPGVGGLRCFAIHNGSGAVVGGNCQ